MAMRKSSRRELNKLRELAHFFLEGQRCFFCRQLLVPDADSIGVGEGTGAPLPDACDVVFHHINGNHYDNRRANKAPAHDRCHASWHMRERHRIAKRVKVDGQVVTVRHDELRAGDVMAATKFTIVRKWKVGARVALRVRHPLTGKVLPLTDRMASTTVRVIRAA